MSLSSTKVKCKENEAIYSHLLNMSKKCTFNGRHNFRASIINAMKSVSLYPLPIETEEEAMQLHGVGPSLAKEILKAKSLNDAFSTNLCSSVTSPCEEKNDLHPNDKCAKRSFEFYYIPEPGKGPWSILFCFFKLNYSTVTKPDLMSTATKLINEGNQLADIKDCWAYSIKTLRTKQLIIFSNDKKQLSLSETGISITKSLFEKNPNYSNINKNNNLIQLVNDIRASNDNTDNKNSQIDFSDNQNSSYSQKISTLTNISSNVLHSEISQEPLHHNNLGSPIQSPSLFRVCQKDTPKWTDQYETIFNLCDEYDSTENNIYNSTTATNTTTNGCNNSRHNRLFNNVSTCDNDNSNIRMVGDAFQKYPTGTTGAIIINLADDSEDEEDFQNNYNNSNYNSGISINNKMTSSKSTGKEYLSYDNMYPSLSQPTSTSTRSYIPAITASSSRSCSLAIKNNNSNITPQTFSHSTTATTTSTTANNKQKQPPINQYFPPGDQTTSTTSTEVHSSSSSSSTVHDTSSYTEVVLLVDSREKDSALIQSQMMNAGMHCEVSTLVLGDFLWVVRQPENMRANNDNSNSNNIKIIEQESTKKNHTKQKKKSASNVTCATTDTSLELPPTSNTCSGLINNRQKKKSNSKKKNDNITTLNENKYLVLDVIGERKTSADLASSIIDGRYIEQKQRLKECGMRTKLYIVEGLSLNVANHCNMTSGALKTAMVSSQINHGLQILRTRGIDHTIASLQAIHRQVVRRYRRGLSGSVLQSFSDFQQAWGRRNATTVGELFGMQLRQVPGCSSAVTKAIVDKYGTLYSLMKRINEAETASQSQNELAEIRREGKANLKLGPKLALHLWKLFGRKFSLQAK